MEENLDVCNQGQKYNLEFNVGMCVVFYSSLSLPPCKEANMEASTHQADALRGIWSQQ